MAKSTKVYPWQNPGTWVTFATPEQVEVTYRVAPFGNRVLAATLDHALVWLVAIFLSIVLGIALVPRQAMIAITITFSAAMAFQFLYFVWAEATRDGSTFGKKRLKLRTVMLTGHGLTLGGAVIRNFARVLDSIPVFWLIPALSRGGRRIGDLLAGTLVIDESGDGLAVPEVRLARSYRELADRRFHLGAETARSLFPEDLNLLEHLFTRLEHIERREERERMSRAVAQKYASRLKLEEQRHQVEEEPRRFLEELYLFTRDRFE